MELSDVLTSAMRTAGLHRLRFAREGGTTAVAASLPGQEEAQARVLAAAPDEISKILAAVRGGGHERLDLIDVPSPGFRVYIAVHSTQRGQGAGGLRRHDLVTPEGTAIQDVLNLSRAMTFKNAVSELQYGGAKACLHSSPIPPYERDQWLDSLAQIIDASGILTGPDSGLPFEIYEALAARCDNVVGVRGGGTSPSAARGVFTALQTTAAALGTPIGELHFAVQGLGGLGMPLVDELVRNGAKVSVTDRDHRRIDALVAGTDPERKEQITVVAPYQILEVAADVLVPCAIGGILDAEAISHLRVRAICGGANNQLASNTLQEDLALANLLHQKGVLFVPDWIASAGGTIHGTLEAQQGESFDPRMARARIQRVCGWTLDEVLETAKRTSRSPLEVALRRLL